MSRTIENKNIFYEHNYRKNCYVIYMVGVIAEIPTKVTNLTDIRRNSTEAEEKWRKSCQKF